MSNLTEMNASRLFFNIYSLNKIRITYSHSNSTVDIFNFFGQSFKEAMIISTLMKSRVVILSLENSLRSYSFFVACLFVAKEVILLNPKNSSSRIESIYNSLDADLVISSSLNQSEIVNVHIPEEIESTYKEICTTLDISDFDNFNNVKVTTLSSGTTGDSRYITHSLSNFIKSSIALNEVLSLDDKSYVTGFFPLTYMAGILNQFIVPLVNGANIIINRDSKPLILHREEFFKKNNITHIWVNSTIINIIFNLKKLELNSFSDISGLFINATSHLDETDWVKFEQFSNTRLLNSYGTSESLFISLSDLNEYSHKAVGKLLPGVRLKIKNDNIMVSSPWNMIYLNGVRQEEGDFIETGDVGYLSENELHINGRNKEVIIRAGFNISPRYLEGLIKSGFPVKDILIIGFKDALQGELVCLVYSGEFLINLEEVNNYIKANVGKEYQIDRILKYNNIPKNHNSKIDLIKIQGDLSNVTH